MGLVTREGSAGLGQLRHSLRVYFQQHLARTRAHDADDLAQETLMAVWKATGAGPCQQVRSLKGFVAATARHKLVDHLRAVGRRHESPLAPRMEGLAPSGAHVPTPEARLDRREARERLMRCLDRLDELERAMLVLSYFGDGDHSRVCRTLGLSPIQGSRIKYRALQRLRFEMRVRRP